MDYSHDPSDNQNQNNDIPLKLKLKRARPIKFDQIRQPMIDLRLSGSD